LDNAETLIEAYDDETLNAEKPIVAKVL